MSESVYGRTMPWPSFADIVDAAFDSHGLLELHGTLTVDGRTWTRP